MKLHAPHTPSVRSTLATGPTRSVDHALIELQRTAGNRAVAALAATVQRDTATPAPHGAPAAPPAGKQDRTRFQIYADLWPIHMTERLTDGRGNLKSFPELALFEVTQAYRLFLELFDEVPESDPVWIKLRIFGRGLAGIYDLMWDRKDKRKRSREPITKDLRTWRYQAVQLGPSLTRAPGGRAASIDSWNDGVVYPLGRAILKSEQNPKNAVSEASTALEILHHWREAATRNDPNRLELIALERGLYTTFQRLREFAYKEGEVDLIRDVDNAIAESKVIGPQIAQIRPPPPPEAAPAPSDKPFVNDTELERP